MILSNIVHSTDDSKPFEVKIVYRGLDGRHYHDHFSLDPALHRWDSYSNLSESMPFEKRANRALDVIARNFDRELG